MTLDSARSRPVDDLPLSTRARNALARARIRTVGDLEAALNGTWPVKLRGLGKPTLDEIALIAEPYLKNLPSGGGPAVIRTASANPITPLIGLELSPSTRERAAIVRIEEFDHLLPTRARNILKVLRCQTLLDVANLTENRLLSMKNSGFKTVRQIKTTVGDALGRLETTEPNAALFADVSAEKGWKPARHDAGPHWSTTFEPTAAGLRKFVDALFEILDQRTCHVVMDRHGLWDGTGDTLQDIAGKLGVTRERVRQIQFRGEQKIRRMAAVAIPIMMPRFGEVVMGEYLKSHHGMATEQELLKDGLSVWGDEEARLCFDFICAIYKKTPQLLLAGYRRNEESILFQNASAVEKYSASLRGIKTALVAKGKPIQPDEVIPLARQALPEIRPDYVKRCAELSKEIGLDARGYVGLRRWTFFDPQRIPDMAMRALMEIAQPAHFSHIVDTMNALFPDRAPFSLNSVQNTISQDSRFVFVRRGHYGLANWGLQRPPYIKDFLAQALRSRGGIAKVDDLVAEGKAKYSFRETSLRMTVSMNPRVFKVANDGTCRLL